MGGSGEEDGGGRFGVDDEAFGDGLGGSRWEGSCSCTLISDGREEEEDQRKSAPSVAGVVLASFPTFNSADAGAPSTCMSASFSSFTASVEEVDIV